MLVPEDLKCFFNFFFEFYYFYKIRICIKVTSARTRKMADRIIHNLIFFLIIINIIAFIV